MTRRFALILLLALIPVFPKNAHAYDCPGPFLHTLPDAREGLYPPDRIVLQTGCVQCTEPPALEVTLEGEPVDGAAELVVTGNTAWVIWHPDAPLQVGLHYDLFVAGFLSDYDFHGVAFIRPADDDDDGRGAEAFTDIEWTLAESIATVLNACCYRQDAEDCSPVCDGLEANRLVLQASGDKAPWFAYWISSDDVAVAVDGYAPLRSVSETEWHLQATLLGPSDSLCTRILARNLLTDETDMVEHCETTDPEMAADPGEWTTRIVEECDNPPRVWSGTTANPEWGEAPNALVEVWCGTSLSDCSAIHNAIACEDEAGRCKPFWVAAVRDDAGVEDASVGDDGGAAHDAAAQDDAGGTVDCSPPDSRGGCSVSPSHAPMRPFAWPFAAAAAMLLIRTARRNRL